MTDHDATRPILAAFEAARRAGIPLGIDAYRLALQAFQCGFGLPAASDYVRVLQGLWATSLDERRVIAEACAAVIAQIPHQSEEKPTATSGETESVATTREPDPESTPQYPPSPEGGHPNPRPQRPEAPDEHPIAHLTLRPPPIPPRPASGRFLLDHDHIPVSVRQIKQSWRNFRLFVRDGPATVVDLDATMREVARTGIAQEPVLMPRRVNRAEVLLLVDHGGSMLPFHGLCRRLVSTTKKEGRLGRGRAAYFSNVPGVFIYEEESFLTGEPIARTLDGLRPDRSVVLIVSDAGAARGRRDSRRATATYEFIESARRHVRNVVWLNPVPRQRWGGTTATLIARYVDMFELDRSGLDRAVRQLQHPRRRGVFESCAVKLPSLGVA